MRSQLSSRSGRRAVVGLAMWSRLAVVGLVLWTVLGCGNKDSGSAKASREDCQQVAEHIADLVVADAAANPDMLWDALHESPGETGIPSTVDKGGFKTWINTPEGKTWMMQRRGQTLAGTQEGVEPCMEKARKADIKCLLATKTKADVGACDTAREDRDNAAK